jgi:hypothetical protein
MKKKERKSYRAIQQAGPVRGKTKTKTVRQIDTLITVIRRQAPLTLAVVQTSRTVLSLDVERASAVAVAAASTRGSHLRGARSPSYS